MKYSIGDKVTDSHGNSVEILECDESARVYRGRKIGLLWPWAAGEWPCDILESLVVSVYRNGKTEQVKGP